MRKTTVGDERRRIGRCRIIHGGEGAESPMISAENSFRDGGDEAVTSHGSGFGCGGRFLHPKVNVDLFKIITRKP